MIYDIIIFVVVFGWSIQKIIDKKLISKKGTAIKSKNYNALVFLFHFLLVLPLFFFLERISLYLAFFIFTISVLSVISSYFNYSAIKKDDVSRVTPFMQFSIFFAVIFSILFLGEKITLMQSIGIIFLVVSGIVISFEKKITNFKNFFTLNAALLLVLVGAFISSLNIIFNKAILITVSFITLHFYRQLSSGIISLPLIKIPKFSIKDWFIFILARILSTYGLLGFFFVLSKEDLVLVVPLIAIQPVIVYFLSKRYLKEHSKIRLIAIVVMVIGYILLKI